MAVENVSLCFSMPCLKNVLLMIATGWYWGIFEAIRVMQFSVVFLERLGQERHANVNKRRARSESRRAPRLFLRLYISAEIPKASESRSYFVVL